eukprot:TRINITY_DN41730_c0_g1_i3.p3 TRINITY_DN41730_c0_g1~~TRINITY_DN41730_c0_g1_i3.p3  ORF type:complete len:108 (-),score=0.74 TRINITY_DN41730_c0_g1_i3:604-927(-)
MMLHTSLAFHFSRKRIEREPWVNFQPVFAKLVNSSSGLFLWAFSSFFLFSFSFSFTFSFSFAFFCSFAFSVSFSYFFLFHIYLLICYFDIFTKNYVLLSAWYCYLPL